MLTAYALYMCLAAAPQKCERLDLYRAEAPCLRDAAFMGRDRTYLPAQCRPIALTKSTRRE